MHPDKIRELEFELRHEACSEFVRKCLVQPINVDVGLVMEEQFPGTLTDKIKEQRKCLDTTKDSEQSQSK